MSTSQPSSGGGEHFSQADFDGLDVIMQLAEVARNHGEHEYAFEHLVGSFKEFYAVFAYALEDAEHKVDIKIELDGDVVERTGDTQQTPVILYPNLGLEEPVKSMDPTSLARIEMEHTAMGFVSPSGLMWFVQNSVSSTSNGVIGCYSSVVSMQPVSWSPLPKVSLKTYVHQASAVEPLDWDVLVDGGLGPYIDYDYQDCTYVIRSRNVAHTVYESDIFDVHSYDRQLGIAEYFDDAEGLVRYTIDNNM